MTVTLCTSGDVTQKAGVNVNLTPSDATWTGWINEAEGMVEIRTGVDWVTGYSGLGDPIKNALKDICASAAAMDAIANDPTGMLTREADMLMNKNNDRVEKGLNNFKDIKGDGNIKAAS